MIPQPGLYPTALIGVPVLADYGVDHHLSKSSDITESKEGRGKKPLTFTLVRGEWRADAHDGAQKKCGNGRLRKQLVHRFNTRAGGCR